MIFQESSLGVSRSHSKSELFNVKLYLSRNANFLNVTSNCFFLQRNFIFCLDFASFALLTQYRFLSLEYFHDLFLPH